MIRLMLTGVLQPLNCVFSTLVCCPLYTCGLEAMTAAPETCSIICTMEQYHSPVGLPSAEELERVQRCYGSRAVIKRKFGHFVTK